jgi:hypothetical protein
MLRCGSGQHLAYEDTVRIRLAVNLESCESDSPLF